MIKIYILKHPKTGEVFYVGITSQVDVKTRLNQHCNHALRNYGNNPRKHSYIRKILEKNLKPKLCVIQQCSKQEYQYLEQYWIRCYRKIGCRLLNLTNGGESIDPEFSRKGGFHARGTKLKTRKCTSIYVGVRFHHLRKKWQAYTSIGKKQFNFGLFTTEIEAAKAYDRGVLFLVKSEVIRLNFPKDKAKYLKESLSEWYTNTQKKYSSELKYTHYCNTHHKWIVILPKSKAKRFDTEEEARNYLTSISSISL